MNQFEKELRAAGYDARPSDFYNLVVGLFADAFPGHTYEWLARDPELAKQFCDRFRAEVGLLALNNRTIMGGLENGRKQRIRPHDLSAQSA